MHTTNYEAALTKLGISVESQFVPWSKSRSFDPETGRDASRKSLNWRVTLKKDGREVITTDYTAGIAHAPSYAGHDVKRHGCKFSIDHCKSLEHEIEKGTAAKLMSYGGIMPGAPILPNVADVVWSLVLDARTLDYPTYEDFADTYGYDRDSRKGEAVYRAGLEIGLKMRAGLGEKMIAKLERLFENY